VLREPDPQPPTTSARRWRRSTSDRRQDAGEITDHENRTLTETRPSDVFFRNYVIFSGQYNETPRLWSPDGSAITYGADTDAGHRFFVHPVRAGAGPAIDLGSGQVAFWSPG